MSVLFWGICGPTTTIDYLVAAEYLAKGYKLSDNILNRAIQLDCEFTVVWLRSQSSVNHIQ